MKLIVGLGNPDIKYANSRHQVGANIIDYLANYTYTLKQHNARLTSIKLSGEDVIVMVPETGMNLSGLAVEPIMKLYDITPENLLVIHDDIDLEFGCVKLQYNKGHGGHNGVRNIQDVLKTKKFNRMRIGVGRPPEGINVIDWVLGDFNKKELDYLNKLLDSVDRSIKW